MVLVFNKNDSKYSWSAEIRSASEESGMPPQGFFVRLWNKNGEIKANLPAVKEDIPVVILLRALDIISDKAIQDLVIYDPNDTDMIEMLRASLEQAQTIRTRE